MAEFIDLALLTDPPHRIPDLQDVAPDFATVRRLNFRIVPGANEDEPDVLEFFFTGAHCEVELAQHGGLVGILDKIRSGGFNYPDASKVQPAPPYKTSISLNNSKRQYVIYVLSPTKNWQFSHRKAPFSVGLKESQTKAYFQARRVHPDGGEDNGSAAGDSEKYGCMIAYFIADGAKRKADMAPNPYTDSYNIHVDLVLKDSDGKPAYVPIDIDPDVRHPGGSGA